MNPLVLVLVLALEDKPPIEDEDEQDDEEETEVHGKPGLTCAKMQRRSFSPAPAGTYAWNARS